VSYLCVPMDNTRLECKAGLNAKKSPPHVYMIAKKVPVVYEINALQCNIVQRHKKCRTLTHSLTHSRHSLTQTITNLLTN
jgi:hypothetical protein